jgi:serine/threonine protein phosphatase PrpC
MVDDETIARTLGVEAADEAAWKLVDEANEAGGNDNISVVVIDVLA